MDGRMDGRIEVRVENTGIFKPSWFPLSLLLPV